MKRPRMEMHVLQLSLHTHTLVVHLFTPFASLSKVNKDTHTLNLNRKHQTHHDINICQKPSLSPLV